MAPAQNLPQLDGPRLAPASGTAKQLVVLVHGYGADGNDLIDLGRHWQQLLPDAAFVSPHGVAPCGQNPMGREWFPIAMHDPLARWSGVNTAAPALDAFLDAELARLKLPPSVLALVGFSQGTMMSLHVGLRRMTPPAGILGYSGLLVLPSKAEMEQFGKEIRSKPPVLLIHGDYDQVIPVQAMPMAERELKKLGVPVETYVAPGLGHGIDPEGLRLGGEFLARVFGTAAP